MSTEKLQEKIESLKGQLAEERELRKAAQRELNETKKLLSRAQSLAAKMGQACAALNEAINEDEAPATKKPKKGGSVKTQNMTSKPSKKDGKKVKADKPKKVSKVVEADEDDEDEAPVTKKVKKGGDKKVKSDKKAASDKGDKKPSKKAKGDKLSKKDKGDKSDVKKGKADKKGKGKSKNNDLDLDDTYED